MPNVITDIRATTEVEAINTMLGAIGETALDAGTDLSTAAASDANVAAAVGLLKSTVRDVLTAGWRFNTLTGIELSPKAQHAWLDSSGTTTQLNIFKLPDAILAWKQTPCSQMQGVELVERLSFNYLEAGKQVPVLFDRVKNRDGLEAGRYPRLYIDPVFSCDFEQMPESARRYSAIAAARRFCQQVPASELQAGFTKQDELAALRTLKREQGLTKHLNLFDTIDAYEFAGRRSGPGGGYVTRVYPGGA